MKQTYSSGGVILNNQGEVLLINEGDGFWGFPKGQIENNEKPFMTALREIQEETGLTSVRLAKDLGTYQRYPVILGVEDHSEQKNITLFLFHTDQELPSSNDDDNECTWVSHEEALEKLSHPKDKSFFKETVLDQNWR